MTRFSTTLWVVIACAAALGLFYVKHEVQRVEGELIHAERLVKDEQRALRVLKAEWSYLNKPERIADLAQRHLELGPMGAERVVRLELIPPRDHERAPEAVPEALPESGHDPAITPTLASARPAQ